MRMCAWSLNGSFSDQKLSGRPRSIMMKLVISTKVEIGFCPMAFKRFCSHSGDGPFFTPLTERAKKAGQHSWSSVRPSGPGPWPLIAGTFSDFSAPRPEAENGRAAYRAKVGQKVKN